ncbi:hypothetical protein AX16_002120 [Volvariella volvacea WC 439]|nr:hypothetical protein AX16_002120 [Volvariella volvacea WC 439]
MDGNPVDIAIQVELIETRFPQDLERIIFEIAARDDRDGMIPVLIQVVSRVRDWLQPIIYDTVVLRCHRFYEESKSPLHNPPRFPAGSQTLYVRSFLVSSDFDHVKESEPGWEDLLAQCYNIQDLAIWNTMSIDALSLLTSIFRSPLRTVAPCGLLRLSITLRELFPEGRVDFRHEIFKHLTHLEVLRDTDDDIDELPPRVDWGKWVEGNNYGCISNLRYLWIWVPYPWSDSVDFIRELLKGCKVLEVLILAADAGTITTQMAGLLKTMTQTIVNLDGMVEEVPEDRVVVYGDLLSTVLSWAQGWYQSAVHSASYAVRGYDVWLRSEKVIQRRRWRRQLDTRSWDLMIDSGVDVDLGAWLIAMDIVY